MSASGTQSSSLMSRMARHWPILRRTVQCITLLAFVVLFVWSRRGGWSGTAVNLPLRLDPLAMLTHALSSHTLLAGSALALVTVALTLAVGRVWCGWLCPMGTLLDLFPLRRWRGRYSLPRSGRETQQAAGESRYPVPPLGGRYSVPRTLPPSVLHPVLLAGQAMAPEGWRAGKYGLLLTILAAALLGNLTLLVLDPLTIVFRTLSASVWPALDQVVTVAERVLYQVAALRPAVSAFDALVRPTILPPEPALYRLTVLYASFLASIVALNLVAARFWCRYLCPLGGLLGILSKAGIVRREVNARCNQCQACARVCPTGTVDPAKGFASDPGECTMCLECYRACPQGAVEFPAHLSVAARRHYDPSRRKAVLAMGTALAGVSLFHGNILSRRDHPRLIRPPGARETELLSKCVRCGECSRACPTSAIQPAVAEAGLEGLWTPVLVPRIGYCDYSCHACGQVCPVQAIPRLTLEEKRQEVVGQAHIDHNRCIAWADHRDCIVCEEMCPVPQKAIILQQVEVLNGDGETVTVKLPEVVRERCIGCGTCENKCPLNGEAAIRVWVPNHSV